MSVVLPRSPALDSGLRGVPRWWRAWSAMNRRHLAAWLLASASMAVVDLTAVVDKLHMAGVSKIMAWDWVTALIIFGFSLLAWVAAVDGAPAQRAYAQRAGRLGGRRGRGARRLHRGTGDAHARRSTDCGGR